MTWLLSDTFTVFCRKAEAVTFSIALNHCGLRLQVVDIYYGLLPAREHTLRAGPCLARLDTSSSNTVPAPGLLNTLRELKRAPWRLPQRPEYRERNGTAQRFPVLRLPSREPAYEQKCLIVYTWYSSSTGTTVCPSTMNWGFFCHQRPSPLHPYLPGSEEGRLHNSSCSSHLAPHASASSATSPLGSKVPHFMEIICKGFLWVCIWESITCIWNVLCYTCASKTQIAI